MPDAPQGGGVVEAMEYAAQCCEGRAASLTDVTARNEAEKCAANIRYHARNAHLVPALSALAAQADAGDREWLEPLLPPHWFACQVSRPERHGGPAECDCDRGKTAAAILSRLAALRAARDALAQRVGEVEGSWGPDDVLAVLVDAANLLLHRFDYDGDGHEQIAAARDKAIAALAGRKGEG